MRITAIRSHEIACGHIVMNHEGKCKNMHGHNYIFTFEIEAEQLDKLGRVIDFSVIKSTLCEWLENNLDHKFMIYEKHPLALKLKELDETVVITGFNPTAENIAQYMFEIAEQILPENVKLLSCHLSETSKCHVEVKK